MLRDSSCSASSSVRAEQEDRFLWLSRYWSTDLGFNARLLVTADEEFPRGRDGPVPGNLRSSSSDEDEEDERR